jgi:hypothetical protein
MHRMIITSNHDDVVQLSDDERRFFVCRVSDRRQGDRMYFVPLWRVANGDDDATLAAFMHELRTRDSRTGNLNRLFATPQPSEQLQLARSIDLAPAIEDVNRRFPHAALCFIESVSLASIAATADFASGVRHCCAISAMALCPSSPQGNASCGTPMSRTRLISADFAFHRNYR